MKGVRAVLLLCLAGGMVPFAGAQTLPVIELTVRSHRIEAEVAHTPEARARGLMHRHEMPSRRGMLFVFPREDRHCMWMQNTFIPLAVAFIDAEGRILNIEEMQPHTETHHCAVRPVRHALEMNGGWFAGRGLKPGQPVGGIEQAPAGY